MPILSKLTFSDVLFSIAAFLALFGTLLIMYAEKHKVKTKVETPGDTLASLFIKDAVIDPAIIAKRKFFDPHNLKMKRIKIFGIILLIITPFVTVWAIIQSHL